MNVLASTFAAPSASDAIVDALGGLDAFAFFYVGYAYFYFYLPAGDT